MDDRCVCVFEGELVSGVVTGKVLGPSSGGIVHVTWLEYGSEATQVLVDNLQAIGVAWMMSNSISIGVGDLVTDY